MPQPRTPERGRLGKGRRRGPTGWIKWLGAMALCLASVACAPDHDYLGDGSLGVVEVDRGRSVQVRLVLDQSEVGASGFTSERMARMAVSHYEHIHGFDVNLGETVNDGCSPEGGRAAARSVLADPEVIGLVGTTCSAAAVTAAPLVTSAGMVMISPTNTSPVLTSDLAGSPSEHHSRGYYRTSGNDLHQGAAVARFLRRERGVTTVGVIHNGDAYTQSLAEAFVDSFTELGGEITHVAVVARNETDLVPAVAELAADSPEALFLSVSRAVGRNIVTPPAGAADLADVLLIAPDALLADSFLGLKESEGMFFSGPDVRFGDNANEITHRTADELLAEYRATYGGNPETPFWGHAYDAAVLLLEAIRSASYVDGETLVIDRAGVREFLDGVSGFAGIIGPISCDRYGDCGSQTNVIVQHLDANDIAATRANVVYEYDP